MRIRIENGRYFLAYKGPLSGSLLRIKPKIEFEVDPHLKDALEDLGYKKIFTLQKEREIWLGVGIELVVDEIKKRGTFIEFRTPNPRGEEEISNCLKKIGIEEKLITKKSYFELFSK
jgi:predicted adenylyl cyclase CyaB